MRAVSEPQAATDAKLTADIRASTRDELVRTHRTTDQRVLARVTDGIYQQPRSAIRVLKSILDAHLLVVCRRNVEGGKKSVSAVQRVVRHPSQTRDTPLETQRWIIESALGQLQHYIEIPVTAKIPRFILECMQ